MRKWNPPAPSQKTFNLPNAGKAVLYVSHRLDTVDVKIRALGFLVRDRNGKVKTESVAVPSTNLRLKLDSGATIVSRSCCKPPDVFDAKEGFKLAFFRLLKEDTQKVLSKADREMLVQTLFPRYSKKKV